MSDRKPPNTDAARAKLPRVLTKNRAPQFRDMTATEYVKAMGALGLTEQYDQAQFFRCVIRTVNGYANGAAIPRSVAMLLRFALYEKADAETVKKATA